MATSPIGLQQGYGIGSGVQNLAPFSIIANRAPTTLDRARIGTFWAYTGANNIYCLTSVTNGQSNWLTLSSGGSGIFIDLTVNGPSTFNGNITQNAGVTSLLATTTAGLSNNGVFSQTGGVAIVGQIVQNTGNVSFTATTSIIGSLTQNGGATLLNTDNIAQTVNIGTGLAAKTVTIGSTDTTSGTAINGGTNGITLNANAVTVTTPGTLRIVPPVDTPAANAVAATINAYSGSVRFNTNVPGGYNVAAGALFPLPFVITNSALTPQAAVLVTVQTDNGTALNCMLRVAQVRNLTNSMEIYVVNDAAAAGNADCTNCIVNFIVMTP